jgi:hypothetical protein
MTASIIAKILEIDHFKLNYRVSEWMHSDFYSENPIPKLELKTRTVQELKEEFKVESMFYDTQDYVTDIESHYPESEDKINSRVKEFDTWYKERLR